MAGMTKRRPVSSRSGSCRTSGGLTPPPRRRTLWPRLPTSPPCRCELNSTSKQAYWLCTTHARAVRTPWAFCLMGYAAAASVHGGLRKTCFQLIVTPSCEMRGVLPKHGHASVFPLSGRLVTEAASSPRYPPPRRRLCRPFLARIGSPTSVRGTGLRSSRSGHDRRGISLRWVAFAVAHCLVNAVDYNCAARQ